MNETIFNFFFSLSKIPAIAEISLFVSDILVYILFAAIIIFVLFRSRPLLLYGCAVACTGASAWIASKILKSIFHIPRPFVQGNFIPLVQESGFSLPSSHATIFAALSVIAFSIDRRLGTVFFVCTLFIGISRIVLGVHYPFDIVLGYLVGALIGLVFVKISRSSWAFAFFTKTL